MRKCGFWLTCILPKDRIYDSVLVRENAGRQKPVFWHILRRDYCDKKILGNLQIFQGNIEISLINLGNHMAA